MSGAECRGHDSAQRGPGLCPVHFFRKSEFVSSIPGPWSSHQCHWSSHQCHLVKVNQKQSDDSEYCGPGQGKNFLDLDIRLVLKKHGLDTHGEIADINNNNVKCLKIEHSTERA